MILIILSNLSVGISAQYESLFGNSQNSWNTYYEFIGAGETDSMVVEGDSIINIETYKKVIQYDPVSGLEGFSNSILLREDTTIGQVWYRTYNSIDTSDHLIIDMSLGIGDTMIYDSGSPWNDPDTIIVDTVYYSNGRKHIEFDYPQNMGPYIPMTMIEGVGLNTGMSKSSFMFLDKSFLLCAKKDLQSTFEHNIEPLIGFQGCNSAILNVNVLDPFSLKLYPNPGVNQVTIDTKMQIQRVSVYSMMGQLVTSTDSKTLNVYDLKNGTYIIFICTNQTEIHRRLVINH